MKPHSISTFLGIEDIPDWPGKAFLYRELPSTNTQLLTALKDSFCLDRSLPHLPKIKEYDIVWSYHQTMGRGRNGKEWLAPVENEIELNHVLTFSVLIKLDKDDPSLFATKNFNSRTSEARLINKLLEQGSTLSHVAAWCWNEVFACHGVATVLKWPNDILFSGKKLVGILTESINIGGVLYLVLGVGVNLHLSKNFLTTIDRPATALGECLETVSGKPISITELKPKKWLQEFLNTFRLVLPVWKSRGFSPMIPSWKLKSDIIGRVVEFYDTNSKTSQIKTGVVEDINEQGMVLVREKNEIDTKVNHSYFKSKGSKVTQISLVDILI